MTQFQVRNDRKPIYNFILFFENDAKYIFLVVFIFARYVGTRYGYEPTNR